MRPLQKAYEKESTWSRISIFAYSNERWAKAFQATVQVQYEEGQTQVDEGTEQRMKSEEIVRRYYEASEECLTPINRAHLYQRLRDAGIDFGKTFQLLDEIQSSGQGTAIARVSLELAGSLGCLVHPAVLDAAIHLSMVHRSGTQEHAEVTRVPRELHGMWISATGWAESTAIKVRTLVQRFSESDDSQATTCLLEEYTLAPLCEIASVTLTPVASVSTSSQRKTKPLYGIDWKPQLSLLEVQQLCQICGAEVIPEDSTNMSSFYPGLEDAMDFVVKKTLNELLTEDLAQAPRHMSRLVAWMERHAAEHPAVNFPLDGPPIEEILRQLSEERPKWKLYEVLGANLLDIIHGQTDPLELLITSGLAETFYSDIFDRLCDSRLKKFLELAAHENPNMRILEVGGGTGGFTRCILSSLR